jgi:hypothetical protein
VGRAGVTESVKDRCAEECTAIKGDVIMRSDFDCGCVLETTPFGEVRHLKCLDTHCLVRRELTDLAAKEQIYRVTELPPLSLDEFRAGSLIELGRFGERLVVGLRHQSGEMDLRTVNCTHQVESAAYRAIHLADFFERSGK